MNVLMRAPGTVAASLAVCMAAALCIVIFDPSGRETNMVIADPNDSVVPKNTCFPMALLDLKNAAAIRGVNFLQLLVHNIENSFPEPKMPDTNTDPKDAARADFVFQTLSKAADDTAEGKFYAGISAPIVKEKATVDAALAGLKTAMDAFTVANTKAEAAEKAYETAKKAGDKAATDAAKTLAENERKAADAARDAYNTLFATFQKSLGKAFVDFLGETLAYVKTDAKIAADYKAGFDLVEGSKPMNDNKLLQKLLDEAEASMAKTEEAEKVHAVKAFLAADEFMLSRNVPVENPTKPPAKKA